MKIIIADKTYENINEIIIEDNHPEFGDSETTDGKVIRMFGNNGRWHDDFVIHKSRITCIVEE